MALLVDKYDKPILDTVFAPELPGLDRERIRFR